MRWQYLTAYGKLMNFPQDHDEHLCEFVSDLKIDQAFIFRCQLICKCNKKKKGLSPKIDY